MVHIINVRLPGVEKSDSCLVKECDFSSDGDFIGPWQTSSASRGIAQKMGNTSSKVENKQKTCGEDSTLKIYKR